MGDFKGYFGHLEDEESEACPVGLVFKSCFDSCIFVFKTNTGYPLFVNVMGEVLVKKAVKIGSRYTIHYIYIT